MKKKLAVGGENFPNMIRNHCYYVDKTGFIRTVMESESRVLLVTRPRRFGKTLFIDTLKSFLQIDFVNPGAATKNAALFSGLAVMQQRDFCAAFMGQYPVISISLKGVEGANYEKAYRRLAGKLSEVAKQYEFLLQSPGLDASDKAKFRRYLNVDELRELSREDDCKDFLKNLTTWLFKHFERQVVLLVDEYDVPLAKAAQFGYYQEMLEMVRSFLGNILKEDPKAESDASTYLLKAMLTGCLRVSKESIFTDVNNFDINTVYSCDMTLSEMIGFTPNEVETLWRTTACRHVLPTSGIGMTVTDFTEVKSTARGTSSTLRRKRWQAVILQVTCPRIIGTKRAEMPSLKNSSDFSRAMMRIACSRWWTEIRLM